VRKVDDKRVHKGVTTLAIAWPADSEAGAMGLFESIDVRECPVNEPVQPLALRDHPLANPTVTRRLEPRRFLRSAS
jgi:hypothetical protein